MDGIYDRLRLLREKANMTQADVAEHLHISREAYTKYESHKDPRSIRCESVVELAKLYHVSCDYILTGVDFANQTLISELGLSNSVINLMKLDMQTPNREISRLLNLLTKHDDTLLHLFCQSLNNYLLADLRQVPVVDYLPSLDGTRIDVSINQQTYARSLLLNLQDLLSMIKSDLNGAIRFQMMMERQEKE